MHVIRWGAQGLTPSGTKTHVEIFSAVDAAFNGLKPLSQLLRFSTISEGLIVICHPAPGDTRCCV